MAAAAEAEAAEKEEGMEIKEEDGVKRDYFEPASSFQGARPGWCFKMGLRGLGYYRDSKQEVKAEKTEKKEEKKEKSEKSEKTEKTEKTEKSEKPAVKEEDEEKEKEA